MNDLFDAGMKEYKLSLVSLLNEKWLAYKTELGTAQPQLVK